jgi:phenylacetate-CoA ligase
MLLQFSSLAPHYQLVLSRDGHLDSLEVLVEAREEHAYESAAQHGKALEQQIKSYIGVTCGVTVLPAHGVERTLIGKARRVIDKRNLT